MKEHNWNIDSIIFDLDGTLWDPTDVVLKAWAMITEREKDVKKTVTREDMKGAMGLQLKEIGEKFFPYLEENRRMELMEACCIEEQELLKNEGGMLFPKLESVLSTLSKKYALYIVSNCYSGYIETFLEYHKVGHYFKDIECAGNTGLSKGENIKRIMERNQLEQPIYVGDTQGDCDGAKLAGIPFVYASYGFGEVETYDKKINSIEDLVAITS